MASDPVFPVRFDDDALDEDLLTLTPRGRRAVIAARDLLARDGLPASRLYRCQPEMHDGTDLGGCVKTRLPWPDGPWGLVLELRKDNGYFLQVLAVGERHPKEPRRSSVYQIAHRRLHSP